MWGRRSNCVFRAPHTRHQCCEMEDKGCPSAVPRGLEGQSIVFCSYPWRMQEHHFFQEVQKRRARGCCLRGQHVKRRCNAARPSGMLGPTAPEVLHSRSTYSLHFAGQGASLSRRLPQWMWVLRRRGVALRGCLRLSPCSAAPNTKKREATLLLKIHYGT